MLLCKGLFLALITNKSHFCVTLWKASHKVLLLLTSIHFSQTYMAVVPQGFVLFDVAVQRHHLYSGPPSICVCVCVGGSSQSLP